MIPRRLCGLDHLKIGKVDGETIIADPDGTLHNVTKNADMVGKTTTFNKKNENMTEEFTDIKRGRGTKSHF